MILTYNERVVQRLFELHPQAGILFDTFDLDVDTMEIVDFKKADVNDQERRAK